MASTAAAGVEMLRRGTNRMDGLPLAGVSVPGLAGYEDLVFGGWDMNGQDLAEATAEHRVLNDNQRAEAGPALAAIRPWPAVASSAWYRRIEGANLREASGHRAAIEAIVDDITRFKAANDLDDVVMVNLASTERTPPDSPALHTADAFARVLHVDGWFFTNILGNRDGQALEDPDSLRSKLGTKGSVLDSILGYPVEDHIVDIRHYRPRGDDKEAWDNIDVTGFLGQRMQIKVNFLCKDSILAAPLLLEIVRLLDLARQRGDAGPQEQLSLFFKAPQTANGRPPLHAFRAQERLLAEWLGPAAVGAAE